MITNTVMAKAISAAEPLISADRSRCVRMRFNGSDCSICTAGCRSGALTIDGGIAIDAGKCTACMLCVSGCPSGCFAAKDENLPGLISRLKKIQGSLPFAVLGCAETRDAHVKTVCLGSLSEEHMIALTVHLAGPLYLNATACAGCRNAFVVASLKERLQRLGRSLSIDIGSRLLLAENKAELVYEEVPLDRRGFFQALKTMGVTTVAGLIDTGDRETDRSYSAKRLPAKRAALNTVVKRLADSRAARDILHGHAFTAKAGKSCTNCSACVGMCPTGALKIGNGTEGRKLLFNSSFCTGCGVCAGFCPLGAMTVSTGYLGDAYFEHAGCTHNAPVAHAAAGTI